MIMETTKEAVQRILSEYLISSPSKKERIFKKHGYTNEEDFLKAFEKVLNEPEKIVKGDSPTDIVVAFDTTGSMKRYIEGVRKHVRELIPTLFKNTPNLRMKIIAFGDYCDMNGENDFGNAYQESELTADQNKLIDFVNSAKDTSGGDVDEFYELVIHKIVTETPWREGGKKSVLFIADCEPHDVGYRIITKDGKFIGNNQINWVREAQRAAEKGIQFDTLRIIHGTKWYAQLSQMTGGACMDFNKAEQMGDIVTASTYARGSKESFMTMYSSTVEAGDEALAGAMKVMSKTINFTDKDRSKLDEIEASIKSKVETTKK